MIVGVILSRAKRVLSAAKELLLTFPLLGMTKEGGI
jgi:hypothetical protein